MIIPISTRLPDALLSTLSHESEDHSISDVERHDPAMFPLTNPDLSIAVDHSALQSFPSPIPCRRKMSFDRGASGTTIFHEEIGDWSRYYELASNGEIETYEAAELRKFASVVTAISNARQHHKSLFPEDLTTLAKDDDIKAVLKAAAKFGLATGRIYITNPMTRKSQWRGAELSGLWLKNKGVFFFITCAHAFKYLEEEPEATKEMMIRALKRKSTPRHIFVSYHWKSTSDSRGEGLNALLLDYDMQNDIAVFQADLPEESENTPHGIDFSDLQTFDRRTPYLGLRYIPSYPLWTVGYSAPDSSLERSTVWSNLKLDKDTATQKDIEKFVKDFPGNFQHANLFDYHLWKHEEVLRQRAEADETCASRYQKAQNSDQPRFEKMFMADHRALAVGSFEKMLDNERTEPRTSKMYHNMSGFLGNSGGMVCHFEGGDILRPKVIGLFYGASPADLYNVCLTFNPAGIVWIAAIINAASIIDILTV